MPEKNNTVPKPPPLIPAQRCFVPVQATLTPPPSHPRHNYVLLRATVTTCIGGKGLPSEKDLSLLNQRTQCSFEKLPHPNLYVPGCTQPPPLLPLPLLDSNTQMTFVTFMAQIPFIRASFPQESSQSIGCSLYFSRGRCTSRTSVFSFLFVRWRHEKGCLWCVEVSPKRGGILLLCYLFFLILFIFVCVCLPSWFRALLFWSSLVDYASYVSGVRGGRAPPLPEGILPRFSVGAFAFPLCPAPPPPPPPPSFPPHTHTPSLCDLRNE